MLNTSYTFTRQARSDLDLTASERRRQLGVDSDMSWNQSKSSLLGAMATSKDVPGLETERQGSKLSPKCHSTESPNKKLRLCERVRARANVPKI